MSADKASRPGSLLPEAVTSGRDEYLNLVKDDDFLYKEVDSLYTFENGIVLDGAYGNEWTVITNPVASPIYANEGNRSTSPEYIEKNYAHIKPENIGKFQLSKILGNTTLSISEAKDLVGKPKEELKTKIKTAGDMLQYMLASRVLLKNGDIQYGDGGNYWHFNSPASVTLSENLGNCGRMANLANYLLEGDYEEVGFILHSYYEGNGGGHVYNYIKYDGMYYIVDFSSYLFNGYNPSSEFNFISMSDLKDYGTRWNECYGGLAAVIAHTSPGTHLPNVWDEEGNNYLLPEGAKFDVLFETPGTGYAVKTIKCPSGVPNWLEKQ